eukprot:Skav233085  [mRNA]  locus=scaffold1963:12216:23022:- [translate_table: standard]
MPRILGCTRNTSLDRPTPLSQERAVARTGRVAADDAASPSEAPPSAPAPPAGARSTASFEEVKPGGTGEAPGPWGAPPWEAPGGMKKARQFLALEPLDDEVHFSAPHRGSTFGSAAWLSFLPRGAMATLAPSSSWALPASLRLGGRPKAAENSDVCGDYVRSSQMNEGRAVYLQVGSNTAMFFRRGCWVVDREGVRDSQMAACYAKDNGQMLPIGLAWSVWKSKVNDFVHDPNLTACNARICGTYHLVGLREQRPLYLLPGKKAVIRYDPESDRRSGTFVAHLWLIDFDALAEPGILGRILQWAFKSAGTDTCSAYADARGTSHPAHVELEWHVWEARQARGVLDPCVRATSAPLKLQVSGRGVMQENGDICGEYFLVGLHKGWPAYQKTGLAMAIRKEKNRWVIDREGLRDSLMCVAYANATPGFQHAGDGGSQQWHVYESRSASHALDLAIQVRVDEPSLESHAKRQRTDCPVTSSQAHFGA